MPHLHPFDKPCFITWRLKFTIPKSMQDNLSNYKEAYSKEIENGALDKQKFLRTNYQKRFFAAYDEEMHKLESYPDILQNDEYVSELKKIIHTQDKELYKLYCYCVMPNHVHVLLEPLQMHDGFIPLSKITQKLKGNSSYMINRLRNTSGSIWHKESYDHIVRSDDEFRRIIGYILNNPVKAGIVDNWREWKHSWLIDEFTNDY